MDIVNLVFINVPEIIIVKINFLIFQPSVKSQAQKQSVVFDTMLTTTYQRDIKEETSKILAQELGEF